MLIEQKLKAINQRHGLVSFGDRVLVAVSGGPDSVALLHLLYELKDEFDLHLEVAHLQHGIRGEEAKEHGRFSGELKKVVKLQTRGDHRN